MITFSSQLLTPLAIPDLIQHDPKTPIPPCLPSNKTPFPHKSFTFSPIHTAAPITPIVQKAMQLACPNFLRSLIDEGATTAAVQLLSKFDGEDLRQNLEAIIVPSHRERQQKTKTALIDQIFDSQVHIHAIPIQLIGEIFKKHVYLHSHFLSRFFEILVKPNYLHSLAPKDLAIAIHLIYETRVNYLPGLAQQNAIPPFDPNKNLRQIFEFHLDISNQPERRLLPSSKLVSFLYEQVEKANCMYEALEMLDEFYGSNQQNPEFISSYFRCRQGLVAAPTWKNSELPPDNYPYSSFTFYQRRLDLFNGNTRYKQFIVYTFQCWNQKKNWPEKIAPPIESIAFLYSMQESARSSLLDAVAAADSPELTQSFLPSLKSADRLYFMESLLTRQSDFSLAHILPTLSADELEKALTRTISSSFQIIKNRGARELLFQSFLAKDAEDINPIDRMGVNRLTTIFYRYVSVDRYHPTVFYRLRADKLFLVKHLFTPLLNHLLEFNFSEDCFQDWLILVSHLNTLICYVNGFEQQEAFLKILHQKQLPQLNLLTYRILLNHFLTRTPVNTDIIKFCIDRCCADLPPRLTEDLVTAPSPKGEGF